MMLAKRYKLQYQPPSSYLEKSNSHIEGEPYLSRNLYCAYSTTAKLLGQALALVQPLLCDTEVFLEY